MILKIRVCVVLLFLLLSAACNRLGAPDGNAGSPFVVAMDLDLPGYFHLSDRPLGYPYELLEAYASSIGREFHVVSENTPSAYLDRLSDGRIDAVAVAGTSALSEEQLFIPLYETSYVVLASRARARALDADASIYETLSGETLLISQRFGGTASCDVLLDSVSRSEIRLSSRNTFELLEALFSGACDFVICEQSEALLGCGLIRNIARIHTFDETVPVGLLFDGGDALPHTFAEWLAGDEGTAVRQALREDYFEAGLLARIYDDNRRGKPRGAVSAYDELFRRAGAEAGIDWRMLAAVAAVESRFNPYLVSTAGARGLMQVMPAVAGSMGFDPDSLMDPAVNIRAGARVMRRIDSELKSASAPDAPAPMLLTLAAYNGGIGTLSDARRLAGKYGADPDSWDDVARYLSLLAEPAYAEDEVVRNGTFRGAGETLAFVEQVMEKYRAYGGTSEL
jgi:membrane-bound lytic murein transglycosylase F